MNHSLRLLHKRDHKEKELTGLKLQCDLCDEDVIRRKAWFETKKKEYEQWKTENKIEGINF